jgi:hypothetical protein
MDQMIGVPGEAPGYAEVRLEKLLIYRYERYYAVEDYSFIIMP